MPALREYLEGDEKRLEEIETHLAFIRDMRALLNAEKARINARAVVRAETTVRQQRRLDDAFRRSQP
jgi:hypothetical protein